jgi:nucleoside phosphorylase
MASEVPSMTMDEAARNLHHTADFGIVTALREELSAVLTALGPTRDVHRQQEDIRHYHQGTVTCRDDTNQTVICVQAHEMGQQPALTAAGDLIRAWNPRHVLLVGIAGGIAERGVDYGDIIVPVRVHYYEPGKLTREGRFQRGPSYDASDRLQQAVEAMANERSPSWASRINAKRPGTRSRRVPRICRGELASGEEVWADLSAQTVREVLERFDKILAVDNEASAVCKAANESSQRPDVLVIKAVSDLVDGKDDSWREYAGEAAAAFAIGLIEKVGGRWANGGTSVPSKRDRVDRQIDVARKTAVGCEFGQVLQEYEKAVELAHDTGDLILEREVRLEAVRAYYECYAVTPLDDRGRARIMSLLQSQVEALEGLGLAESRLAVEKSYLALINEDGEQALESARHARKLAEEGSDIWAQAALCEMMAYCCLGRPEEALDLFDLVFHVQHDREERSAGGVSFSVSTSVGIAVTRLQALRMAERATHEDAEAFCRELCEFVAKGEYPPKRAALAVDALAAEFNHPESQAEVLTLLECASELAEQVGDPPLCCTIALQAAEVAAQRGDEPKARLYLGKAATRVENARRRSAAGTGETTQWRTLRLNWLFGKGRALVRLWENLRGAQGGTLIIEEAYEALKDAKLLIQEYHDLLDGDVDLCLADLNVWLGDCAAILNRPGRAATCFRAARSEAARANAAFWADRAVPAWLREAEALALSGRVDEASRVTGEILADPGTDGQTRDRASHFKSYLDNVLLPTRDWLMSSEATAIASLARQDSLRGAVSRELSPLVNWWQEWAGEKKSPQSELLDFWGRGGFTRVSAAIRARPLDAIAVDARSVEDIAQWARIFCPLFETVIVKWKGRLGQGLVLAPIPNDYGGADSFGGHGYLTTSTSVRDGWHIKMAWANPLPGEVTRFLSGEALPLVRSGRLVVVPAPLVGCTQTAVGWTDSLLVDGFLGGIVEAVGRYPGRAQERDRRQRLVDLCEVSLPYVDGISLADLARVLDETAEWVPWLRSALLKALGEDLRRENWASIQALNNDIQAACRELNERLVRIARLAGGHVQVPGGTITAGERGPAGPGSDPITNQLRSVASGDKETATWIPYWRLRDFGGWLDWTCPIDNPSSPPERSDVPALYSWLCPGTGGWGVALVCVPDARR